MPVPRKRAIGRQQHWGTRHLAHLLCGIDWRFMEPDGWGDLYKLGDDDLRETVADMQACWRAHKHLVTAEHTGMNPQPGDPWFAEYADDPEKLIREARMYREYQRAQRKRGGYFPWEQFVAEYEAAKSQTRTPNERIYR